MKMRLLYIQSSKESWAEAAEDVYHKKIKAFGQFEVLSLKAKSHSRAAADQKKAEETKLILSKLDSQDINILFDEKGHRFSSSLAFANDLQNCIESSRRISFFVGGAYGVDPEARTQFQKIWSFSNLTMNHHLAKIVALEQVYRALTILKSIPYHNQ